MQFHVSLYRQSSQGRGRLITLSIDQYHDILQQSRVEHCVCTALLCNQSTSFITIATCETMVDVTHNIDSYQNYSTNMSTRQSACGHSSLSYKSWKAIINSYLCSRQWQQEKPPVAYGKQQQNVTFRNRGTSQFLLTNFLYLFLTTNCG